MKDAAVQKRAREDAVVFVLLDYKRGNQQPRNDRRIRGNVPVENTWAAYLEFP
jgi:hypothetical protein